MARVVCVGMATLDSVALVDRFPAPDERVIAERLVYAGGGPAATAAVAAARLGVDVELVAATGEDTEGQRLVHDLAAEGVGVTHVRAHPDRPTNASVIISAREQASRAICTRVTPPLTLDDEAARAVLAADWVHADHIGWPAVQALLAGTPALRRPRLSVDAGNPVPAPDPVRCDPADTDLYVPTVQRLRDEHGDAPVERLLEACGAPLVVATLGADGSIAREADGTVHRVPGLPVEVVSTLGAGDVFHGALVAAMARELPLPDAMTYAGVTAALSCRGVDGRSAIPGHEEVVAVTKTWENP